MSDTETEVMYCGDIRREYSKDVDLDLYPQRQNESTKWWRGDDLLADEHTTTKWFAWADGTETLNTTRTISWKGMKCRVLQTDEWVMEDGGTQCTRTITKNWYKDDDPIYHQQHGMWFWDVEHTKRVDPLPGTTGTNESVNECSDATALDVVYTHSIKRNSNRGVIVTTRDSEGNDVYSRVDRRSAPGSEVFKWEIEDDHKYRSLDDAVFHAKISNKRRLTAIRDRRDELDAFMGSDLIRMETE